MPFRLGPTELLIILGILVILFGVGRIAKVAGELGTGIHTFRDGLSGKSEDESKKEIKAKLSINSPSLMT